MKRYEIIIKQGGNRIKVELESFAYVGTYPVLTTKKDYIFNKKDRSLITRITKFIAENIKDLKE